MMSVIVLSVVMLSVIMLSVIMLSVIKLSVIMLNVVAPIPDTWYKWTTLFLICHISAFKAKLYVWQKEQYSQHYIFFLIYECAQ